MRPRAFGVVVGPLISLLATAPVLAQVPPLPASQPFIGFVSPYEIVHRVRTAGFDPLAPPLREGTTYVVRAVDFRGVLMRVVLDARTGVIRDVAPIVPGPGRYGQYAYGSPPPYDPADFDAPMANLPAGPDIERPAIRPVPPAAVGHPSVRSTALEPVAPPLPRPRPAARASRKPDIGVDPNSVGSTGTQPTSTSSSGANPAASQLPRPHDAGSVKPGINSEIITAAPPPASVAPRKSQGDPPIDN